MVWDLAEKLYENIGASNSHIIRDSVMSTYRLLEPSFTDQIDHRYQIVIIRAYNPDHRLKHIVRAHRVIVAR